MDTGRTPPAEEVPAAVVLRPDRAPAAARLPGDHRSPAHAGASPVELPRGRRLLGRALARPSLPRSSGCVVVVVFFGVAGPRPAHRRRAGRRPGRRRAARASARSRSPCCSSPATSTSPSGSLAVASSLVTALLIEQAGWGIWPALAGSLAGALLVGLVNGCLVVRTGLPSFLVTLATFLVLQGTSLAGAQAIAGSTRVTGLDEAPGWSVGRGRLRLDRGVGDGRFRVSMLWWLAVDGAGHLGAVAHALRQRRLRHRRRPAGRPGARRPGAAHHAHPVLPAPPRPAGWSAPSAWSGSTACGGRPGAGPAIDFIVVAVIGGCLLTGGYGSAVGASVGAAAVRRRPVRASRWPAGTRCGSRPSSACCCSSRCWPTAWCAAG